MMVKVKFKDKEGKEHDLSMISDYNDKDFLILLECDEKPRSTGELTKILDIAPVNTWKHLKKLEERGIIIINREGKGKKNKIMVNKKNKIANSLLILAKVTQRFRKATLNRE